VKLNRKLTAVIPDVHIPYQDKQAVELCLQRIKEERAGRIVILGDLVDFEAISRFSRKLEKRAAFEWELGLGRKWIKNLSRRFRGVEIHFLAGNHESRLSKYVVRNCPELSGLPQLALEEILEVPKSWRMYSYNLNAVHIDGVNYIHGRKFSGNVCMSNLKKYMGSVVQGHSHRASSQYLNLPSGKQIGAVEAGCLCDLNPAYAADVDWSHAMAWAENGLPYLELL
jgi:predicted phosphodiesterase